METIKIHSRFGELTIDPKTILTFKKGILGFEHATKYALVNLNTKSPLKILQCIDDESLTFVVTNPAVFISDYEIHVKRHDIDDLEIKDLNDVIYLVIVTVPRDPSKMTANLKGPILINTKNQTAKQVILDYDKYPVKYCLLQEQKKAANS